MRKFHSLNPRIFSVEAALTQNLFLEPLRTLLHRPRLQCLRILRNILLQRPFITTQLRPRGLP
jgi:hypothetical protein